MNFISAYLTHEHVFFFPHNEKVHIQDQRIVVIFPKIHLHLSCYLSVRRACELSIKNTGIRCQREREKEWMPNGGRLF